MRRGDFRLDNLVGFDLHGKTVGIIGCDTIGGTLVGLLQGFSCRLLGYLGLDVYEHEKGLFFNDHS